MASVVNPRFLTALRIAQLALEELIDRSFVSKWEIDHGVDNTDIGWHGHEREFISVFGTDGVRIERNRWTFERQ